MEVQGCLLDNILTENGSVLEGFSLEKFRSRIVTLEDNVYGLDKRVSHFMTARGYVEFRKTGCDDGFVR